MNDERSHDNMMASSDQTFYFIIADCQGALEIY